MRASRLLVGMGSTALLLLVLIGPVDSSRWRQQQQMWRQHMREQHDDDDIPPAESAAAVPQSPTALGVPPAIRSDAASRLDDAISLRGCGRLFIDGGSNTGESVRAFTSGGFFTCALHSPSRQYNKAWGQLSRRERVELMRPLREPASFCIRSFEAAPELLRGLGAQEAEYKRRGVHDVRFINAALGNATSSAHSRTVVRYADNYWGSTAVGLRFEDVHVGGKPTARSARTVVGQSFDLRQVLRRALQLNQSSVIAVKLDIEGFEYWTLAALAAEPELLCAVSYLFVEFHSSASEEQRTKLKASYGLRGDDFEHLKTIIHGAMERPGCRLKVYWRSFWASCGDKQRFEWRTSAQATMNLGGAAAAVDAALPSDCDKAQGGPCVWGFPS